MVTEQVGVMGEGAMGRGGVTRDSEVLTNSGLQPPYEVVSSPSEQNGS